MAFNGTLNGDAAKLVLRDATSLEVETDDNVVTLTFNPNTLFTITLRFDLDAGEADIAHNGVVMVNNGPLGLEMALPNGGMAYFHTRDACDVMDTVRAARAAARTATKDRADVLAAVAAVMHAHEATCTERMTDDMRVTWQLYGATIVVNLRNGAAINVVGAPYNF